MKVTAKRIRLALRSPGNFVWAARRVLRDGILGECERRFLAGRAFKPNLILVNITSRCNLRCAMCMQPRPHAADDDSPTLTGGRPELTPEQWSGVIDQAAPARPAFYFSGGEPLLYRGLDRVLAHVKERGLIAALVTNATTLAQHAESLVKIGVDNVTISLDGPEEVHDYIRSVAGTFRRATEGVRALREARRRAGVSFPTIKINCVVTPHNVRTLLETVKIARDLGVEELNLQHPMFDTAENIALHNRIFSQVMKNAESALSAEGAASKGEGEFYDERLTEEQYEDLEAALDQILAQESPRPRVVFFPPVRRKDWRGYYLDLTYPFRKRCTAPWTQMRLLADGTFEPCLHYAIGNVLDRPLWELWNDAQMRRFRVQLARNRLFPACVRCCYRSY